jgi:hypothetical protein
MLRVGSSLGAVPASLVIVQNFLAELQTGAVKDGMSELLATALADRHFRP